MKQIWRPVAYPANHITIENEFHSGSFVVPYCMFCGDVPRPCYPDTVRHYNQQQGFTLVDSVAAFHLVRTE
jgi:hypothetical protein